MSRPIVLILGAGANIGRGTANAFLARGYSVALVSRKAADARSTANTVNIAGDLSKPESVPDIFNKVKKQLGVPEVVVYNAAAATGNDKSDPLSLAYDDFCRDMNINTNSAYVAMQ